MLPPRGGTQPSDFSWVARTLHERALARGFFHLHQIPPASRGSKYTILFLNTAIPSLAVV